MKCLACDTILSDFEACRKYSTGQFIDLCNRCFHSGISEEIDPYIERDDLRHANEQPPNSEGIITIQLEELEEQ